MASFPKVSEGFSVSAEKAVHAAEAGNYAEYDHADLVVAGVIQAIEKGAPGMFSDIQSVEPDDFFRQDTQPNKTLLAATARFLQVDDKAAREEMPRGDAVEMIVGDIVQQVSAWKIVHSLDGLIQDNELNETQRNLATMAKSDEGLLSDFKLISNGNYSDLSPEMAESMEQVFAMPIEGNLGEQVKLMKRAVEQGVETSAEMDSRHIEEPRQLDNFAPLRYSSFESLSEFRENNVPTGNVNVDDALRLLASVGALSHDDNVVHVENISQARMIQSASPNEVRSPAALAASAMAEAEVIYQSRALEQPDKDQYMIGHGAFERLDPDKREEMARKFYFADALPAIDKVKLEALAVQGIHKDSQMEELYSKSVNMMMLVTDQMDSEMIPQAVDMDMSLIDYGMGSRDPKSMVSAAENLVEFLGDKPLAESQEFKDLSAQVDIVSDKSALSGQDLQDAMYNSLASVSVELLEEVKHHELSESNDLYDAVYAQGKDGSDQNNRNLMDAAEGLIQVLDDKGLSTTPSFDKVAITVDRINDRHDFDDKIVVTPEQNPGRQQPHAAVEAADSSLGDKVAQDEMFDHLSKMSSTFITETRFQEIPENVRLTEAIDARDKDKSEATDFALHDAASVSLIAFEKKGLESPAAIDLAAKVEEITNHLEVSSMKPQSLDKSVAEQKPLVAEPAPKMTAMQMAMQAAMSGRSM